MLSSSKTLVALLFGAGLTVVGCSHDGADNRPPPTAPVEPYQDQPGINHEQHGPAGIPPTQMQPGTPGGTSSSNGM